MPARTPTSETPESQLLGAPTASRSVSSAAADEAKTSPTTAAHATLAKFRMTQIPSTRRCHLTQPERLSEDHRDFLLSLRGAEGDEAIPTGRYMRIEIASRSSSLGLPTARPEGSQ